MASLLAHLLPGFELVGAGWLLYRLGWKRCPALLGYLATEAAWNFVGVHHYAIAVLAGAPFRMLARAVVVAEIFRLARATWTPEEIKRTASVVFGAITAVTILISLATRISPLQSFLVFRQFYHIGLAVAVWTLIVRSWRWPMLEARTNRAYRYGMAAWFTALAFGGTFVPSGLGYVLFPSTYEFWGAIRVVCSGSYIVAVAGLTAGMTISAPKRKAAAAALRVQQQKKERIAA